MLVDTTLGTEAEYVTSGSRDWSRYYADTGAIFIRTQDINRNRLSLEAVAFVQLPERVEGKRSLVKKGDLLITITGANVGKVAAVDFDIPEAYVSQSVCLVRLKDPATAKFIQLQLMTSNGEKSALEAMAYGLGRPVLNLENIRSAPIKIGPLQLQQRIVAEIEKQFSRLDEAVANLQRVKANLKRYKASVLKDAVEGRLVPTEAELARREGRSFETGEQLLQRILEARRKEWKGRGKYKVPVAVNTAGLPALPSGWTWATIEQLTYLVTSGSRGWGDFYSENGVLFIRAQDIKTDALNMKGLARVDVPVDAEGSRSSVGADDILVTITGANVTKSALVPMLSEPAFVSQHVALLKLTSTDTAAFVFNWLVSPANGRKTLEKWAYGAGKPGLSLEQVRALPVAVPPIAEQTRIVDEVERRLSLVRGVEAEVDANLKRAQALRQSALSKAFSVHQ